MAGFAIRPLNHVIETVRIEGLRRQMHAKDAYAEIGRLAGGIPVSRIRSWLNGEYRLTPARLAVVTSAVSAWLGGEYTVEAVIRLLRQARATWIEHEKTKLAEMDGEWFQQALALYLRREPPAQPATTGPIEEEGAEG